MVDKKIVYEALKRSRTPDDPTENQDSLISLLIHDIFGGEILKTPKKRVGIFITGLMVNASILRCRKS